MNIVIEIPDDDQTSGGIQRMIKLALELPHYTPTSGGVMESVKLAEAISPNVHIRFQRRTNNNPVTLNSYSFGLPDWSFPACDVVITYSDNPYLKQLTELPQVKKVLIYMLSFGMCFERERPNVLNPNVTVMCSTKKLQKSIESDGVKVHRVGFGLDMKEFINNGNPRGNNLALMFHNSEAKQYDLAVDVADQLYSDGIIDGVITFGNGQLTKIPKGLTKHYQNATKEQVSEVFNQCKAFLMPSISEGLNLTPFESSLCGCTAVLVDGAFDELFFDDKNCLRAEAGNKEQMIDFCSEIICNFVNYSEKFEAKSREILPNYTWDKVIENIMKLI